MNDDYLQLDADNGKGYVQSYIQAQHLYIISSEEIKVGDWCINANEDTIYQPNCLGDFSGGEK
jgi:hypothetical protein